MVEDNGGGGIVSPELDRLSCELLGRALDSLAAGTEVLALASVEDSAGRGEVRSFSDDSPEACLVAARDYVRAPASPSSGRDEVVLPERYAIVYDGDVADDDGAYRSALILEFGERGSTCGYSAFVLYEGFGEGEGFSWSDPEPAGEEELLL